MKLSEAMRKGIEMSKPYKYSLIAVYSGDLYACAMGAAHLGNGGDPNLTESQIGNALLKTWPELDKYVEDKDVGDYTLRGIIWSKNDQLDWTREQIADWLEGLGY